MRAGRAIRRHTSPSARILRDSPAGEYMYNLGFTPRLTHDTRDTWSRSSSGSIGHAAGQSLATPSASSRWMMVALQLLLAVLIVRMFEIERRRQLFTMLAIAIAGFPIYFQLPYQWRSWFFVFLTGLTSALILGWAQPPLHSLWGVHW